MSHMQKTDARRVSPHRRHRPHRARQRAESPGELGDDGHEDRPDRAALRLQRLRLAHDRGERRLGGEHDASHDDGGDRAPHSRRRASPSRAGGRTTRSCRSKRPARPREPPPSSRRTARRHRLRLAPVRRRRAPSSSAASPFRATCISSDTPTATPSRTRSPTRSSAPRRPATSVRCSPINDPANDGRIRSRCCASRWSAFARSGGVVQQVDVTIIAEKPRIASHRELMRVRLAAALTLDASQVSVKGKTNEGMGWIGRGEGIACIAVATIVPADSLSVGVLDEGAVLRFQLDRFGDFLTLEQGTSPPHARGLSPRHRAARRLRADESADRRPWTSRAAPSASSCIT